MSDDEIVEHLGKDKDFDAERARALLVEVNDRDYNPPKRERILEWAAKQDFPICPGADNPDMCNVYRTLDFPEEVYKNIERYRMRQAEGTAVDAPCVFFERSASKYLRVATNGAQGGATQCLQRRRGARF